MSKVTLRYFDKILVSLIKSVVVKKLTRRFSTFRKLIIFITKAFASMEQAQLHLCLDLFEIL